jgi:hypothetical protein
VAKPKDEPLAVGHVPGELSGRVHASRQVDDAIARNDRIGRQRRKPRPLRRKVLRLGRRFALDALDAVLAFRRDIGETTDQAAQEPAKLAELKTLLEAKYHEVRDQSPVWPAWKSTGAEGKRIQWPDYVKKPKSPKPR